MRRFLSLWTKTWGGYLAVVGTLAVAPMLSAQPQVEVAFTIDPNSDTGPLPHFWTATGFTPPTLIEDERMRVQMAHLGGVPNAGLEWARVHDLLTLVKVEGADTDRPRYDWSRLDRALEVMLDAGMRPFFEVMGRPEGFTFTDVHDPAQLAKWRRLVRDLARHLIDRYGQEEVRSWVFEVWNEPDVHPYFEHPWAKDDAAGLILYYDATSAGLMDADPQLRFGGPGTAQQLSIMFTGLMKHLDTGTNHLTGQSPPRCDFISVHVKGGPWSREPIDPVMDRILDGQRELYDYLVEHHPRLAELPFINNEADPVVGWKRDHHWRGKPYYASFLARLVHRQLSEAARSDMDFALMSNDFGFLGGWGQRSVMVPFAGGDGAIENQTTASTGVSMVKKPVLEVMTMLSLLGDRTLAAAPHVGTEHDDAIRCLVSKTAAGDLVFLVSHHRDDSSAAGTARVRLDVAGGTGDWPWTSVLQIGPGHTNPHAVWDRMGRPDTPTPEQLDALRDAAELTVSVSPTADGPITLELPMHSVALVILSDRSADAPAAPDHVRARVTPGLHGDEVLIRWRSVNDPRRLRGYRVEAMTPDGVAPLGEVLPIATTLTRPLPAGATGVRVEAIDTAGRVSERTAAPISSIR